MENSSFSERLALLPEFDADRRTAVHVQGQRSYAKFYESEGRSYMSSWHHNNSTHNGEEVRSPASKPADTIIGTPILKPRVKNLAKPVEPSKVKTATKTVITVESSNPEEKDQGKRNTTKSKKREGAITDVDKNKRKTVPTKKKRVSESASDSSRAERLRERRERKRAKRAVVEPETSDKENDKNESRTRNKKLPAGFALMHGFSAMNVGKERLTIKPSVNIGVFGKGKASARTKAVKTRMSAKKSLRIDGYFSESKFLNKSKREIIPPDRSSNGDTSASSSSHGSGAHESPKGTQKVIKADKVTSDVPNKEVMGATSSPAKKSKASSIIWDIELGKSLCRDDCSMSITPIKRGSVVLNTGHHTWAKVLCKKDAEKKGLTQDDGEAPLSIGPSQSASQGKIVSPAMPAPEKGTCSKYFQTREPSTRKVQDKATTEPLVSLCSFNESSIGIVQVPMTDDHAENTKCFMQNGSHGREPELMQDELEYGEHIQADLFPLEVRDHDLHIGENYLNYGEDDVLGDFTIFDEYQDPQYDDGQHVYDEALVVEQNSEEARKQVLDEYASFPDELELGGYSLEGDGYCDYFNDATGQGDLEMKEVCDNSQGENILEGDRTYDNEEVDSDHDQAFESVGQTDDEEPEAFQTNRFSQGRALLLGCSTDSTQGRAISSYRASAEVDVVKHLRDHWRPQKL